MEYFYKQSKVKGQIYLQIWQRTEGGETYLISLGSAGKCYKKLVSVNEIKTQTNNSEEFQTNSQEGNQI